jgi:hypothetical protein
VGAGRDEGGVEGLHRLDEGVEVVRGLGFRVGARNGAAVSGKGDGCGAADAFGCAAVKRLVRGWVEQV